MDVIEVLPYDGPLPPWEGPLPPREREPWQFPYPCANCARVFVSAGTGTVYCTDLCRSIAELVRYYKCKTRERTIRRPDIHEYIGNAIAHIAGGGYPRRSRRLRPDIREFVVERDRGRCVQCGEVGTDIDHKDGSSNDPLNLQLLCRSCHDAKTCSLMEIAPVDVIASVHAPLITRAKEVPGRQPCDVNGWDYARWRSGHKVVEQGHLQAWSDWADTIADQPLTPAIAVVGFPRELDPWLWYGQKG